MLRTQNPVTLRISPLQHALACFVAAAVLFSLAARAYACNESTHFMIYLALGAILAILGLGPLVMHLMHGRTK